MFTLTTAKRRAAQKLQSLNLIKVNYKLVHDSKAQFRTISAFVVGNNNNNNNNEHISTAPK